VSQPERPPAASDSESEIAAASESQPLTNLSFKFDSEGPLAAQHTSTHAARTHACTYERTHSYALRGGRAGTHTHT
jgi:hypothetical protein